MPWPDCADAQALGLRCPHGVLFAVWGLTAHVHILGFVYLKQSLYIYYTCIYIFNERLL